MTSGRQAASVGRTSSLAHIAACACGFDLICPWDRYCAGCGVPLSDGFEITESIRVGRDKNQVAVCVRNRSRVAVTVDVPHIGSGGTPPPQWIRYDRRGGGARTLSVAPGADEALLYEIDRDVIQEMVLDRMEGEATSSGTATATSFPLPVFTDEDYTNQARFVRFALIGQADLRPAAVEYPMVWLTLERQLALPLKLFNASGSGIVVDQVTIRATSAHPSLRADDGDGMGVAQALFPPDVFAGLRDRELGPGQTIDLAVCSRPIAEALRVFAEGRGVPLHDGPYAEGPRCKEWYWKWPELVRLRFVVELSLRADTGESLDRVRSLVVVTLVRPPLLRDATPDDQLWKAPEGIEQLSNGIILLGDHGFVDAEAHLNNDSAIPVVVKSVRTQCSWLEVLRAPTGIRLQPGDPYLVRVRIDPSRRAVAELQQKLLQGHIEVETVPPIANPRIEPIIIQTKATVDLPGCLGIDFGTSNCSVCFLPGGDWVDDSDGAFGPVELNLEKLAGTDPSRGMSSTLWRRVELPLDIPDPEFAFGTEAEQQWPTRPSNVLRAVKRMLSHAKVEYTFVTNDVANPIVSYTTQELAARMIRHVVRQAQELATTGALRDQVRAVAEQAAAMGRTDFPSPEEVCEATAYRFERAVFTHPVEADENLKRVLYGAAREAGLAVRSSGSGEATEYEFEAFARECMVDEATAAITHFVSRFRSELVPVGRGRGRPARSITLLCLDIGGGTTDISVMEYTHKAPRILHDGRQGRGPELKILNRSGINSFAGEDLDVGIVQRVLAPILNAKLQKVRPGAEVMVDDLAYVLRGASVASIETTLKTREITDDPRGLAGRIVEAAHHLRQAAEQLKKASHSGGQATISLPFMPPFREGNTAVERLDDERGNLQLHVDLDEVSSQVQEMVRDRLPRLDEAVLRANRVWDQVDVLLFTGQSTRSANVRSPILQHVGASRITKLPYLAIPSKDGLGAAHARIMEQTATAVLEFDPKLCVPGGASIFGTTGGDFNRVQIVFPQRSQFRVASEHGSLERGTPLPSFLEIDLFDDPFPEALYDVGQRQQIVKLEDLPDDVERLVLVLVGEDAAYLVGSSLQPMSEELAPELASALEELPVDRAEALGLKRELQLWWRSAPLRNGGADQ